MFNKLTPWKALYKSPHSVTFQLWIDVKRLHFLLTQQECQPGEAIFLLYDVIHQMVHSADFLSTIPLGGSTSQSIIFAPLDHTGLVGLMGNGN